MNSPAIRNFQVGDLARLQSSGVLQTGVTYPLSVYEGLISREPGCAFSAVARDQVIGCAGIIPLWNGVGEAWSFLSEEVKRPFFLHRAVKQHLGQIIQEKKLHRVQMNVLCSFEKGFRWAEALGFRSEGILHDYTTDKQNYRRYALWQIQ